MSTELQIAAACVASYLLGFGHRHLIAKDRAVNDEPIPRKFAINVPPPPSIEDKINEIRLAFPDARVRREQHHWRAVLRTMGSPVILKGGPNISAWEAWELLYIRLKDENII
jgi:hypothetical protein